MRHFHMFAEEVEQLINYSLAFIASLTLGSAILHVIMLVLGRRRPRDDMEMGPLWLSAAGLQFRLQFLSQRPCADHLLRGGDLHLRVADVVAALVRHRRFPGVRRAHC